MNLTQNSYRGVNTYTPYPNCPYTGTTAALKCRMYSNATGLCFNKKQTIIDIKNPPGKPCSQLLWKLTAANCSNYVEPTNEGIKYGSYDRVYERRRSILKPECKPTCCKDSTLIDTLYFSVLQMENLTFTPLTNPHVYSGIRISPLTDEFQNIIPNTTATFTGHRIPSDDLYNKQGKYSHTSTFQTPDGMIVGMTTFTDNYTGQIAEEATIPFTVTGSIGKYKYAKSFTIQIINDIFLRRILKIYT